MSQLLPNINHIFYLEIEPLPMAFDYSVFLSQTKKEKLVSSLTVNKKAQQICVELLLNYAIIQLGLSTKIPFEYSYDSVGKPSGEDNIFKFSVSHTDTAVAVAVSPSAVGVDIERADRTINNAPQKILNYNELQEYNACGKAQAYLLRAFVAKESLVKAVGTGFVTYPSLVDTTSANGYNTAVYNMDNYIIGVSSQGCAAKNVVSKVKIIDLVNVLSIFTLNS